MSRAVGKPVRVQWMREDEHGWEPKGPAQLMTARAGVDAQGKVMAWDFMDRSFPWTTNGMPLLAVAADRHENHRRKGIMNGTDGGGEIYAFENQKVVAAAIPWIHPDPTPLRTSNLRAPGDLARSFASESFMDEIASAVAVDPVQFRLRYLSSDKRPTEALLAATKKAGWQERPSPVAGLKRSESDGKGRSGGNRSNTMTAAVAEVEVDKTTGKILVKRVVLAHDCGLIVNPDGLSNQIQGNVIQGVSRTLMEEVKFDANGRKEPRLEKLPDHHVRGSARRRSRLDQSHGNGAAWWRRAVDRSRTGGDCQRCFRCHRSPLAGDSVHAGARVERLENLKIFREVARILKNSGESYFPSLVLSSLPSANTSFVR